MDIASGVAVAVLQPQRGEHVLDLCCAPGAKLSYLHDFMGLGEVGATGSVTGVDCNAERMNACRAMLKKYGVKACFSVTLTLTITLNIRP